ncbi:MAG: CDP-alcohol phosphatidyltransferase family protein [Hyphomicrobiales bacterium]|nr:CDP-alcohol phosphatidyltransferase family protein [Hyphomicrobiales bacterium]
MARDTFDDGAAPPPARPRFGVPPRLLAPNLVTLAALALGLTAIRFATEGSFLSAEYCIAGAAILDGLDGRLARAVGGASRFGAELDSLADFVDFGVAPAILLYRAALDPLGTPGWFAAIAFAVACALRLARFNVALDGPDRPSWTRGFFTGMPAPAGAIVGLLPLHLALALGAGPATRATATVSTAYVVAIAALMASRIPHFSGKDLPRVPRERYGLALFAVAAAILTLVAWPVWGLVIASACYLASTPLAARRYAALEQADRAAQVAG